MESIYEPYTDTFDYEGEKISIEVTEEFHKAIKLMEGRESLFITGKAGTGKSTLLKYFRSKFKNKKEMVVLSFTGLAAINVEGQTIHSFFRFPLGFMDRKRVHFNQAVQEMVSGVDTIIIDEVSMIRADLMDAIDKSLRIHRKNSRNFGGVQMIFIGDLYQLPPIIEEDLTEVYGQFYKSPFFFHADVFNLYRPPLINLEKIHRQKEHDLIEILNNVRERKNLPETLENLNKRVITNFAGLDNNDTIVLCTTNVKAKEINELFLNRIQEPIYRFNATVEGEFDVKSYPTDKELILKKGAKIIFVKNDPDKFFVNGDVGIITQLSEFAIDVRTKRTNVRLRRETWEKTKYRLKDGKVVKQVIGTFEQYPLRLAWAITIHKSQGQTYDSVIIDLDRGAFTSGQTYVALSRSRTMDGIHLKRAVIEKDIILDERILEFKHIFLDEN